MNNWEIAVIVQGVVVLVLVLNAVLSAIGFKRLVKRIDELDANRYDDH